MASTPNLDGNSGVYIGAWTNWSHGSVRGATITLTARDGALLIAFLAFYVGLAGSSFWRIACFAIHQLLSSDRSEDGLYHQRQAILRNSATDVVGLWNFVQTNWFWRRNAGSPFRRILPLVAFSTLHIAVFGVAGIFSSQVSTAAGNDVLVSSSKCGYLMYTMDMNVTDTQKWLSPYHSETVFLSSSYAQQCYRQDAVAPSCRTFIQPSISTTSSTAACPFNGMCVGNGNIALVLDTGHINSNFDLGLNAPPEDRFTIRKVSTCAPITTVGYSTSYHNTNSTADDYVEYYYGSSPRLAGGPQPYTYRYPSHLETSSKNDFQNTLDYTIMALEAYGSPTMFNPIPRLKRSDADISLFFLSANNMVYVEPVDDPWYSAHLQFPGVMLGNIVMKGNASIWFRDNPVGVLGCAEQYQFCNPNLPANSNCTSLVGLDQAINMTDGLWRSPAQNVSFYSIRSVFDYGINLNEIVAPLGISSLTARNSLRNGVQGPLSNNQWQLEVQYWHSISLALLQRMVVELATGPTSETVYPWLTKPQTKEEQAQCHNQKIINTAYTNFSILGLSIILVVGALLLLTSVSIDLIVGYIQKRRNPKNYKRLEWSMNQTFQLQRLAHEELGYGTWTHAADSIPTTQRGEKLSLIDTSDPDHPILVAPTPADHASVQESEAKPDQDAETTQSGGHPTPLEPAPINEVPSTDQSSSTNDETLHAWQPNTGSTRQTNKVTTVLQTVSVNGSAEVGGSSSSRDEGDALRVAENQELGNTSSNSIENDSPPISEDPILEGPVRSTSFTV